MGIASKDIREVAVRAYLKGKWSMEHIGDVFGVHCKTISRWVVDYINEDRLEARPRGHMSPSFSEQEREDLARLVEENIDLTLEQIKQIMGKTCTLATVHNTLKDLGFRLKKKHYERVSKTEKT